jgi:hypothetical protein
MPLLARTRTLSGLFLLVAVVSALLTPVSAQLRKGQALRIGELMRRTVILPEAVEAQK